MFYKQPQAQIAENLSTLLSTLSASDLVQKVNFLEKLLLIAKKYGKKPQDQTNSLTNFTKIYLNLFFDLLQLRIIPN